ncbi:alpha/beta fold hydrolase [Spirosoma sp. KNUC1025]|uniref:alpha/beta fold hydrolase n=1 Tax=Spirosoma sp. KNUC1025 TaxID=2894082 RepID=UPI0038635182|nr:alpha/beta hydrolase [Spirosoma sp. KNUC1025]
MTDTQQQSEFQHQQLMIKGVSLHVITTGQRNKPAVLFLHGFPENWASFAAIMAGLRDDFFTIALDLPGIGQSGKIAANDKKTVAGYVKGVIDALELNLVTLVGHDVGGMITYAYLHAYPNELTKAVIMNVAVPGIDPWAQVKQNPNVWHFRFNTIPDLPETLVADRQRPFFDYFFNTISAKPENISEQARSTYAEAYATYDALHTGFEWYRTFAQDEKDNEATKGKALTTSVLYLRGEREYGNLDDYINGFRESGLTNVQGKLIPGSGHYAPDESPEAVIEILKTFLA